jgi:phospholipid-binding lipoprotein MlaA
MMIKKQNGFKARLAIPVLVAGCFIPCYAAIHAGGPAPAPAEVRPVEANEEVAQVQAGGTPQPVTNATDNPSGAVVTNSDQTTTVTPNTNESQGTTVKDPYEWFNRPVFTFNDKLDKFILKPIATGYNAIMPTPLNQGIHNVFLNIGNLPTIANDLLQFNFYQSANDIWRLIINTTVGVGGLFDIGSRIGLKQYSNDFGLTLAAWGYENSNYLVLPFFGPSTPRDGVGIPVDYFLFSIYPYIQPESTRYEIYGLGVVDRRAQLLKYQQVLEEAAVDRYAFVRDAYMQRRAYQIQENDHLGYDQRESLEPVQITAEQEAAAGADNLTNNVTDDDEVGTDNKTRQTDATNQPKKPQTYE